MRKKSHKNKHHIYSKVLTFITLTSSSWSFLIATPLDIKGVFGTDYTTVRNYRKTDTTINPATNNDSETGEFIKSPAMNEQNAAFNSFLLKIQPTLVVNDSASFFSEFNIGDSRSSFWGDNSTIKKSSTNSASSSMGNSLYLQNEISNGPHNLVSLSEMNMELYSDIATWAIGRQNFSYGLGAVFNSGENLWDRHHTVLDGASAKIKIGNFNLNPFWFVSNLGGDLSGAASSKFYGISFLYDNVQKDLALGIHLSWKKSNPGQNYFQGARVEDQNSNVVRDYSSLGQTEVKITDFFFKKSFGNYSFKFEIPLIRGDLGKVYSDSNTKYKALGLAFESTYQFNESWKLNLNLGHASGDNGDRDGFKAMYFNPNYQIANILFRYNWRAIGDNTQSIYDSYIVNARYLKLGVDYEVESWLWSFGAIYAQANETAKANSFAYDHQVNKIYYSRANQSKNLGLELDANFAYKWNSSVSLNGGLGVLFPGEYYSYVNSNTSSLELKRPLMGQFGVALSF